MTRIIEFEKNPGLKELQSAVGGLLQIVPDFPKYKGRKCNVMVDEEGLLKNKPINQEMTKAWREYLDGTGIPYDRNMATLVGDAVVVYGDLD